MFNFQTGVCKEEAGFPQLTQTSVLGSQIIRVESNIVSVLFHTEQSLSLLGA